MELRQKNSKKKKVFQTGRKKDSFFVEKNQPANENLQVGDVFAVKISALGSKNIGVAELKNGYTVLVPNTKCGQKVHVKIGKVFSFLGPEKQTGKQKASQTMKYAAASVVSGSGKFGNLGFSPSKNEENQANETSFQQTVVHFDFKVGQKFKVTISKKGPKNSGLVQLTKNFLLIVPNGNVGEEVVVEIQKMKQNYAFATKVENTKLQNTFSKNFVGQQFNIVLPQRAKTLGNYFVVKFNGNFVFVKKSLGVQGGDTVRIQIQKSTEMLKIAKILKISPLSQEEKKFIVKQTVEKMIQSSMHFGEKAIRCNANMRKFLWYRKKNTFSLSFSPKQSNGNGAETNGYSSKRDHLAISHPKESFQNGKTSHLKKSSSQNLKPMVKRGRHILNVFQTTRCLNKALKQLAKYAAKGKTFLFVGTKKPAASLIAKTALLSNTSFFVNTRWLGGMLTNWKTILKSISQIRPILKQKQKILQKILEKRQKIQRELFLKVSLLRKKTVKFMIKGKYLIRQILLFSQRQNLANQYSQNGLDQATQKNFFVDKSEKFQQRKKALLSSNMAFLNSSKNLKYKKQQTFKQLQQLEMAALEIVRQKQQLKSLMATNVKKFKEFEQLFEIGQQLTILQNSFEKNNGKKFVALSYEKFKTLSETSLSEKTTIPNPSPEIFKKMISLLSNLRKETQSSGSEQNVRVRKLFEGEGKTNRAKSVDTVSASSNTENQTVLLSKFLQKFLLFVPFLKTSMEMLSFKFKHHQKIYKQFDSVFTKIANKQKVLKELYKKIVSEFQAVSQKFIAQKQNFVLFQAHLKQLISEQRLVKFFPKLRYLPTSSTKMYETIELFMKKFVDPKLVYPMEQIYDQKLKFTSKKIATTRKQKWQRLEKYFGGITKMAKMKNKQISKNVAIIIGQQEEMNAVHECRKLGMKIFAVVDTNCNPKFVDHIIPANDDSRNSIKYILGEMLTYIRLGQKLRKKVSFRAKEKQNMNKKRRFS
jgi:small subunit ribosomal protein S2